jgi:hypothetical protein
MKLVVELWYHYSCKLQTVVGLSHLHSTSQLFEPILVLLLVPSSLPSVLLPHLLQPLALLVPLLLALEVQAVPLRLGPQRQPLLSGLQQLPALALELLLLGPALPGLLELNQQQGVQSLVVQHPRQLLVRLLQPLPLEVAVFLEQLRRLQEPLELGDLQLLKQ